MSPGKIFQIFPLTCFVSLMHRRERIHSDYGSADARGKTFCAVLCSIQMKACKTCPETEVQTYSYLLVHHNRSLSMQLPFGCHFSIFSMQMNLAGILLMFLFIAELSLHYFI